MPSYLVQYPARRNEKLVKLRQHSIHMANLTKRDLVVKISNETGLVQHQVFEVLQRVLDHIVESLSKGVDVELRNFGVFEVRLSKARVGRNPNIPGSNFAIPPRATVKFKSGKVMRQKVLDLSQSMLHGKPHSDSSGHSHSHHEGA